MLTTDEYKEWIAYHKSLFPTFGVWLNDDLKVRGNSIFKSFQNFNLTLDELKQASDKLLAEDPNVYPRTHCAAIVELIRAEHEANELAKRKFRPLHDDGQQSYDSYRCPQCRDTGRVEVYHPRAYLPIREGTVEGKHIGGCIAACNKCERGEFESNRPGTGKDGNQFKGLPRFNRAMLLVTERDTELMTAELTEFVNESSGLTDGDCRFLSDPDATGRTWQP